MGAQHEACSNLLQIQTHTPLDIHCYIGEVLVNQTLRHNHSFWCMDETPLPKIIMFQAAISLNSFAATMLHLRVCCISRITLQMAVNVRNYYRPA
jgi:hypothetical protein